jgi:hypothetical protein
MPDSAHDATRPVNGAVAYLARLRWELRSQAARARAAREWVGAVPEVRPAGASVPLRPWMPAVGSQPHCEVLPGRAEPAAGEGERRLRVVVSEQRQVSLEFESRIGRPAPEIDARHSLAS